MTRPAGWYDDRHQPGMRRFWNGHRWTDVVVPADRFAPKDPGGATPMWRLLLRRLASQVDVPPPPPPPGSSGPRGSRPRRRPRGGSG